MRSVLLICALHVVAAPAWAASEKPKLAVLDVQGKGVDKATAETVTDIITVALKKLGVFDVISRADIQQMLNFEESKQLLGCTSNTNCIAEIGGALGVARVVTGSLGKLGDSYVLNLTLLDTRTSKVIEREQREAKSQNDLAAAAANGARFLVRALLEGKQGDVLVNVSEAQAEIEIDGKLIGLSPLQALKLASGPHTVRISKKGFVSFARDFTVDERNATVVDAAMVPSPEFIGGYDKVANGVRIGSYVAVGVGVAALATGIVLFYGYNDPRFNAYQADYKIYTATPAARTAAVDQRMSGRYASISTVYTLSYVLGIGGAVLAAAGIVGFFVGPKPGIYDRFKSVSVGSGKLTLDVGPTIGGAYSSATLTF